MPEFYKLYFKQIPDKIIKDYEIKGIITCKGYEVVLIKRTHNQSIPKLTFELASKSITPLMIHNVKTSERKCNQFSLTKNELNKLNKINK